MKKQKLSLYSGIFGGMVGEINETLAAAFDGMKAKEIEESTVTIKISLALKEVPVVTEGNQLKAVAVPVIAYKLQNAMKYVVTKADVVDTGGMELETEADGSYVLSPAVGSQVDIAEMLEPDGDDTLLDELAAAYPEIAENNE